jgi:hypothetical protein
MRDLIKTILKEYTKKDIITLEEIFLPNDFLETLIAEGKTSVKVNKSVKTSIEKRLESYYNWPKNINKEWCSKIIEIGSLEGKVPTYKCNKRFDFNITDHWYDRLFRTQEPDYQEIDPRTGIEGVNYDPKIVDPGFFEGIDLFFNDKERINNFIESRKNWGIGESIMVKMVGPDGYSQILGFLKNNPKHISVSFVSQLKGVPFRMNEYGKLQNI